MHFAFLGKGFTLGVFCCTNTKTKTKKKSDTNQYNISICTEFTLTLVYMEAF